MNIVEADEANRKWNTRGLKNYNGDCKMYNVRFSNGLHRGYYNAGYVTCKCWKRIICADAYDCLRSI